MKPTDGRLNPWLQCHIWSILNFWHFGDWARNGSFFWTSCPVLFTQLIIFFGTQIKLKILEELCSFLKNKIKKVKYILNDVEFYLYESNIYLKQCQRQFMGLVFPKLPLESIEARTTDFQHYNPVGLLKWFKILFFICFFLKEKIAKFYLWILCTCKNRINWEEHNRKHQKKKNL